MFKVGDIVIMKAGAPYGMTKGGSIGRIVKIRNQENVCIIFSLITGKHTEFDLPHPFDIETCDIVFYRDRPFIARNATNSPEEENV